MSILATLYDDPLKNYFDIPQKHGMVPKIKEEEDLNNQELLQDDEVISFSHSSRIPGKVLVVCIDFLKVMFEFLSVHIFVMLGFTNCIFTPSTTYRSSVFCIIMSQLCVKSNWIHQRINLCCSFMACIIGEFIV